MSGILIIAGEYVKFKREVRTPMMVTKTLKGSMTKPKSEREESTRKSGRLEVPVS